MSDRPTLTPPVLPTAETQADLWHFWTERDRRYEQRFGTIEQAVRTAAEAQERAVQAAFVAQDKAVQAAFTAQEKLTQAAFAASKEAIAKAEASQIGVNERGNEFRGQLADQAATLMPRKETEALAASLRDLTDRVQTEARLGREGIKTDVRLTFEALRAEIASLRESRSESGGRRERAAAGVSAAQWAVTTGLALLALLVSLGVALARH